MKIYNDFKYELQQGLLSGPVSKYLFIWSCFNVVMASSYLIIF